jgi:hypothetical protein
VAGRCYCATALASLDENRTYTPPTVRDRPGSGSLPLVEERPSHVAACGGDTLLIGLIAFGAEYKGVLFDPFRIRGQFKPISGEMQIAECVAVINLTKDKELN